MRNLTVISIALLSSLTVVGATQNAVASEDLFSQMSKDKVKAMKGLEKNKICTLALKTYDYAVKDLGLAKPDSKQARRASHGLPFRLIDLESSAQTSVIFEREIGTVKSEFSKFKSADGKEQKNLLSLAKSVNKTCGKTYDDRKLAGYSMADIAYKYIPQMSSKNAQLCKSITLNNMRTDRTNFTNDFFQYLVWGAVYERELRREGYPEDQLIERAEISEVENVIKDHDQDEVLELYETCPETYKKAKFEAKLKVDKDVDTPVPAVNWD